MADGRVTITLGRNARVVKRGIDVEYGDHHMQGVGSKRSVRDRLGSNFDNGGPASIKRQRGESYLTSSNGVEDVCIGKDDLRLKLIQKNASRRAPRDHDQGTMDLRKKLSRTQQPAGPSVSSLHMRQHISDPKEPSILGRVPSRRSADDLQWMDSSRNSYSPWTLDHIRRRSPDRNRIIGSSRGLSPPRNMEGVQRKPLNQTFDDARAVSYMNRDVLDAPRPVSSSTALMPKPIVPAVAPKPAASILGQVAPPSSILGKTSYVGGEHQTVESLLHSLGLGKYAIIFKAEEVDMTALKQMGEHDLKELGIPMGPRKKILLALVPRSKRQP